MTAPTRLVWELAGRPLPQGATARAFEDVSAPCAMCRTVAGRTALADRALGQNFTDRSLFVDASAGRVCEACVACCSGKPPATFRMWSVVAAPGQVLPPSAEKAWIRDTPGLCLTSRANPRPIIDILTGPPAGRWLVSVALSGQKHVLPYTAVNSGDGVWRIRMETVHVSAHPEDFKEVFSRALALRRLGIPADDIWEGRPRHLKTLTALEAWRHHSGHLTPHTHSPLLTLALWTITKGIIDDNDTYPHTS